MDKSGMFKKFGITDDEYTQLLEEFGDLCRYEAWQLKRKNAQNNLIDTDVEDIIQDQLIAMIRAGVYYKRQVFIEACLEISEKHVKDRFMKNVLSELQELWNNRTKHGAHRRKFGDYQEKILECIVNTCIPPSERPDYKDKLRIDKKFRTYCKQITWNQQKSLGRKITKERSIRSSAVSLSEYDYLGQYK